MAYYRYIHQILHPHIRTLTTQFFIDMMVNVYILNIMSLIFKNELHRMICKVYFSFFGQPNHLVLGNMMRIDELKWTPMPLIFKNEWHIIDIHQILHPPIKTLNSSFSLTCWSICILNLMSLIFKNELHRIVYIIIRYTSPFWANKVT